MDCVFIRNASGCDKIVTILESVKSRRLDISNQNLSSSETRALVQAMETRVEEVRLGYGVTIDNEALTKYSGQGNCHNLDVGEWEEDIAAEVKEQIGHWCSERNNWIVKQTSFSCEFFRRKLSIREWHMYV